MSAQALKPVPAYEDGTLRLEDGRVMLRRPLAEDAPAVARHMNDFEVVKNLSRAPWPYTRADAESWLAGIAAETGPRAAYPFAIVTGGALAGVVGISTNPANPGAVELGYWLGRPFWGQGYATQAARLAVRFAFDALDLAVLEAGHFADNPASGRVLQKLGFTYTEDVARFSRARDCDVACRMMTLGRTRFASPSDEGGASHGG